MSAREPTSSTGGAVRSAQGTGPGVGVERRVLAPPSLDRIARLALPLACGTAWLAIAAFQREPSVAAEAGYLGVLVTAVLLAALHAAPRISTALGSTVVLLGAVPWALPGTADRGVATGLLLAGALALAACTGSTGQWRQHAARSTVERPAPLEWPASRLAALVIGAQILARGGDLLAPSTAQVIATMAWAAVAIAAILLLGAQVGARAAMLAGATAFLLGPGFVTVNTLALAAVALGSLIADRRRALALRMVGSAALAATLLWSFEYGALLLLGALAFAGPRWSRWIAGLAALIAFFAPGADRWAGVDGPAWLLVLVPVALVELRPSVATRFAAISIALAAAAQMPDRAALALPAVLLAAGVSGERPLATALQSAWTGVLAFAVAVVAAYPWLRADALESVAALLGLGDGWRAVLATLLLLVLTAAACLVLDRLRRATATSARTDSGEPAAAAALAPIVLAVLLGALVLDSHPAPAASPISRQPVDLDARAPRWTAGLDTPVRVGMLAIDSSLSHAAALPPGTVVAQVSLSTTDGERTLPLRAGIDTGEWAARRPDVATLAGFAAPEPWLHWVDQGRRFFGQRYRAPMTLERPATVTAVEVRLAPDLPPDVAVTLFHLELR